MPIADVNVVRRKVGNRSPEILPDADIEEAIQGSDAIMCTALNKYDWNVDEPAYYAVKEISELFAAADILARYQADRDWAKEEYERAQSQLKIIQENFSAATGDEEAGNVVTIVSSEYHTYPMNPNALYRRPYGMGEASERLLHEHGPSITYETE